MANRHWLEGIVANTCAERVNVPGYGTGFFKKAGWFGMERIRWGKLFSLSSDELEFFELHEAEQAVREAVAQAERAAGTAVESVLFTSLEATPSAARACWSTLTLRVAVSGSWLRRTWERFGSALAVRTRLSRTVANCAWGMPDVFCSSMVKPVDWPRPRIEGGISANTCASRKPRNAADARCTIAGALF